MKLVKDLVFQIYAKPSITPCLEVDEIFKKTVGEKGQGSVLSVMFWNVEQKDILWDDAFQLVALCSCWATGKTICLKEKARQVALANPGNAVHYWVVTLGGSKKSLLEMEAEDEFAGIPNIRVASLNINSIDVENTFKKMLDLVMSGGHHFFDEVMLPNLTDPQLKADIHQLAQYILNQPTILFLWLAIAGVQQCSSLNAGDVEAVLREDFFLAGLHLPLRSNKAVLSQAGAGKGPTIVGVADGSMKTRMDLPIPCHLLDGVKAQVFTVNDWGNQVEVEVSVRRARQAMEDRLGQDRGVPVMCTGVGVVNQQRHNFVCNGLQGVGRQVIKYGAAIDGSVGDGEVQDWLERRRRAVEQRDLYTEDRVTRGWEVDAGIVVQFGVYGGENLAMRVITHLIVVKKN